MKKTYLWFDIVAILTGVSATAIFAYGAARAHGSFLVAWIAGFTTIVLIAAPYLRSWRERISAYGPVNERVEFDGESIRRTMQSGKIESIQWTELSEIEIRSTDGGPWSEDLYWLLLNQDRSKGCAIPNNANGFADLLVKLQALRGFDNQKVIEAMSSTKNDWFLVWRRDV